MTEKQKAVTDAENKYNAYKNNHKDAYEALDQAETKLSEATNAYNKAKADYDAALKAYDPELKAKADEANTEYDKELAGFYTWLQEKTGVDLTTAIKNTNLNGYTDSSKEADATTLKHVKDAIS